MDTALYYTFSTIAQALAAAMALLAAFAMYRLSAISAECFNSAVAMEAETGGGINVRVLATASNWAGVHDEIERRVRQHGYQHLQDEMRARLTRIQRLRNAHRRVLTALLVSLGLTAVVIATSIGVLAYVPRICASGNAQGTLNVGITATAACLLGYLWLVIEAFRA